MMIRPNLALRPAMDQRERGAATLEGVGMYAVAAILAAAVMLAAVSTSPVVGDRFRQAICILTTLGQGSCESSVTSAADHKPTEPCVVSAEGHTGSVEASFVVTVGENEHFLVEKLNNGKTRVTRGTGNTLGYGTGVGFNVTATVQDKTYGVAAGAEASLAATFSEGNVYYADNDTEVAKLLSAHAEEVAKQVVSDVPGGSLAVEAVNTAEGWFHFGNHFPPAVETYVQGGGTAKLNAQVAAPTGSAEAAAGAEVVLGRRLGADGTSTTYLQLSSDLNLAAGMWANSTQTNDPVYAKAAYERNQQAIVEVERDAKGNITAVRVRSVESGDHLATLAESTSGPGKNEYYTETVKTLRIRTATDQAIAQRYLNAAGAGPMGGFKDLPAGATSSVPILNPFDIAAASDAFDQAAGLRGFITKQAFDDSKSTSSGAKFDAKLLAKISGGATIDAVNRTSRGLRYYNGSQMVPELGCGGN